MPKMVVISHVHFNVMTHGSQTLTATQTSTNKLRIFWRPMESLLCGKMNESRRKTRTTDVIREIKSLKREWMHCTLSALLMATIKHLLMRRPTVMSSEINVTDIKHAAPITHLFGRTAKILKNGKLKTGFKLLTEFTIFPRQVVRAIPRRNEFAEKRNDPLYCPAHI